MGHLVSLQLFKPALVSAVAWAARTKYGKLNGLKQKLVFLEFWRLEAQGQCLANLFLVRTPFLAILLGPHMAFPQCLHVESVYLCEREFWYLL